MTARLGGIVAILAACLILAPAAGAQAPSGALTQVVPVSGKATKGGKTMSGTYAIDRFVASGGRLAAIGTLRGRLGNRRVAERGVRMPVQAARQAVVANQPPLPPLPNACQILNLVLGPINLDLLGLVVRTNRINLRIDAQRGPGNLLGNLLCAITGLLDPQTAGARQTAQGLNAALALVPRR